MRLVCDCLTQERTLIEFAPGNGCLGFEVAKTVKQVFGVDITNLLDPRLPQPDNYRLIVYDGYQLDNSERF